MPEFDKESVANVATGNVEAVGGLVDQWADRLYAYTDALRIRGREADDIVEEVVRRLAFDSPRFVARPEKLFTWVTQTLKDCAAAVLARRAIVQGLSVAPSPVGAAFSLLVGEGRIADALVYLNSQTPFRFTGVYRVSGLCISNLYLYDRQTGFGSDQSVGPVAATFCLWVQETLSVVQMTDSMSDPRAVGHAKREAVRSYCGGPIRSDRGELLGTICHFDYEPHIDTLDVFPILAEIGPSLAPIISQ